MNSVLFRRHPEADDPIRVGVLSEATRSEGALFSARLGSPKNGASRAIGLHSGFTCDPVTVAEKQSDHARATKRSRGIRSSLSSGHDFSRAFKNVARSAFRSRCFFREPSIYSFSLLFVLFFSLLAGSAHAQEKKTAAGEEFFMVASLDQSKSQLLLKRPTEVTLLAKVTPKTQFLDEKGKGIQLSDLRAGDTVWAVTVGGDANTTVTRLRKGPMTVADLHKYYLDYPEVK